MFEKMKEKIRQRQEEREQELREKKNRLLFIFLNKYYNSTKKRKNLFSF